jgi:hypothetical protein
MLYRSFELRDYIFFYKKKVLMFGFHVPMLFLCSSNVPMMYISMMFHNEWCT